MASLSICSSTRRGSKCRGKVATIPDGLFEAIAAHVAMLIFLGPKGIEGIMIPAINRCAGQAEQECVRESGAHLHAQVTFLGAMGFIHQGDNILPGRSTRSRPRQI